MVQTLANSELVVATQIIIDFPKRCFIHYFTVILPSVTQTLDDSNLLLTQSSFCLATDHFCLILPSIIWILKISLNYFLISCCPWSKLCMVIALLPHWLCFALLELPITWTFLDFPRGFELSEGDCLRENVFIDITLLYGSKGQNSLVGPVTNVCHNVTVQTCSGHLHYGKTFIPPSLQTGLDETIFSTVINSKCSTELEKFLCYTQFPPCYPNRPATTSVPCKSLCDVIDKKCWKEFNALSIPLPDCNFIYPRENTATGLCSLTQWPAAWPKEFRPSPYRKYESNIVYTMNLLVIIQ